MDRINMINKIKTKSNLKTISISSLLLFLI